MNERGGGSDSAGEGTLFRPASILYTQGLRVSAVSYLNTWPLVWGFLHGPEQGFFDFRFDLPAQCAAALESGDADIGLVPTAELDRLELDFLPELGIACEGPVRSILLISKCPYEKIRTLAADSSSRTSVALARILLSERFDCREPLVTLHPPRLPEMLAGCDAALIIGDPALLLEPAELSCRTLDLGAEWVEWTGLPMVFAVWAGRREALTPGVAARFSASYRWGRSRLDEIVQQAGERGFPDALAREYLTRHIVYELSERHLRGLELFRSRVRALKPLRPLASAVLNRRRTMV
jgi:chorismate dehydratase